MNTTEHTGQARAQRGGRQVVAGAPVIPSAADYREIELALIDPSKTNPRKQFGDLEGLAATIEQQGVIGPLTVRPKGKRFEIVAGERRYRSAKIAKLEKAPCIVRVLSDADAIEVQGIENLQRQNLTPMEEAAQYRLLIDTKPDKFNAETIGKKQGKSATWVWDIMKLLDLVPEAKKLLDEGRISVNHAIPIARLTPTQQKKIIDPEENALFQHERHTLQFDDDEDEKKRTRYDDVKPISVKELQAYIAEHVRFNPQQAAKAAPLLFENVAEKVAQAAAKSGRGKKLISITHNSHVQDDAKDPNERTFSNVSWRRADGKFDSNPCDSSVLGVVVLGRRYGEAFEVCVARDKCRVHFAEVIRAKEKRQKENAVAPSKPGKTKAVDPEVEKNKRIAAELEEKAEKLALDLIRKAAEAKLDKLPKKLPKKIFAKLLEDLATEVYLPGFNAKAKDLTQDNLVYRLAIAFARDDLENIDSYLEAEAIDWAHALGVDVKKLRTEAQAQVKVQTSGAKKPKPKK